MMPLDPIVSLAVAIAEAPGTCACLLGSGVSVDAGIPTGWQIYRDGLRRLYRLENDAEDTPDDDDIDAWLAMTGRPDLGYAALLDLVAPDPAIRRALLAGYFEGIEPGRAHELLADMAAAGWLQVFVTTNFDRLLERALVSRGIDPVVVSDDATLAAAPRREHSKVFIVKAHGDYLQETIRNTPSELVALEAQLTTELEAIGSHYGMLVVGWSGSDAALADVLRTRRSRYGVWWLARTAPLVEPARTLAEVVGARVIVRPGASELFDDLARRLKIYGAHESGQDPGTVHDETLSLVQAGEPIRLEEWLRTERYAFESAVEAVTSDHINHGTAESIVRDAWTRLQAAAERRLASLIPLALYRSELLKGELRAHGTWATTTQLRGGGMTWQQAWRLPFWMIGMTLGGLLVRLERYAGLRPLLAATWTNHHGTPTGLIFSPSEISGPVAKVFGPPPPAGRIWSSSAWAWLTAELRTMVWLTDRYPEWLRREGEPERALTQFDLLMFIAARVSGDGSHLPAFTVEPQAAQEFARRLHDDQRLREQAAGAVGLNLTEFDERAPGYIADARSLDWSGRAGEIANALASGRPF